VIFSHIAKHIPRDKWPGMTFVDAFLGSGAVSLYAKAQGFRVVANDVAERSVIAGQALIENNDRLITDYDLYKFFNDNNDNSRFIQFSLVPKVFTVRHAMFLDKAFSNARKPIDKYLLLKYIFTIRPYSKFSSPNAFNIPLEEGRYDEIKNTYTKHIADNMRTRLAILKAEKDKVNRGIFSNGLKNEVHKQDVFEFINDVNGDVLYLDPPYAGTLAYEDEYAVLDKILGDEKPVSRFSMDNGMDALGELLEKADKFPLWVISFGNAAGKNDLNKLIQKVTRFRKCIAMEFVYRHCEAMASEEHKEKCREWLVFGWK